MAHQNVPQVIHRLQSYRLDDSQPQQSKVVPFPKQQTDSEAIAELKRGLHWRSRVHLFTLQALQFLIPEPPDDDDESGPDYLAGR